MTYSNSSITAQDALMRLPPDLVTVSVAGTHGRPALSSVLIADADSSRRERLTDAAVLGVSAHDQVALNLVRACAEQSAAVLVLRTDSACGQAEVVAEATAVGIALWELTPSRTWTELHTALLSLIAPASQLVADDELIGLAQTVATLTGGLVSIEDMDARVLAYSASGEEVDELRRLSILGRTGPSAYLALLQQLGVYDRLAIPEHVVEVDEDLTSGIRRRLAVGIFAGTQQMGTIWIQQGAQTLGAQAESVLLGASRVVAADLAASRIPNARLADEARFRAVLAGRSASLLGWSARIAATSCVVAAFALEDDGAEPPIQVRWRAAVSTILKVNAAAVRARALVTEVDGRIYVLLPNVSSAHQIIGALENVLSSAALVGGGALRAGLGQIVPGIADVHRSRRTADLALEAGFANPQSPLAIFDAVRPRLLVEAALARIADRSELEDPGLAQFVRDEPVFAQTLLTYLSIGSDAAAVGRALAVHVTTVRYRLRRAGEILRLDLTDPNARLAAHLQLRAALSPG